jgi:hypothetical protein
MKALGMRHKLLTAVRYSLFLASVAMCAGAPSREAVAGEYLAYFNRPSSSPDSTIRTLLLAYINGAQPGSQIFGHITTDRPPAQQLSPFTPG